MPARDAVSASQEVAEQTLVASQIGLTTSKRERQVIVQPTGDWSATIDEAECVRDELFAKLRDFAVRSGGPDRCPTYWLKLFRRSS